MSKLKDDAIAPIYCQNCGKLIPKSRRGHGHPPKTCSEQCRKERAAKKEKVRYSKVKDTDDWKATRAYYVQRLKKRMETDPEYSAIFHAYAAAQTKKWTLKVKSQEPERYQKMLEVKRQERALWRKRLVEDPVAYEAYRAACKVWYDSLSKSDRERIYYEPARKLLATKNQQQVPKNDAK